MENFGYVFASKMLVEKKLPVMFMYREKASNGDSGWRFFSGLEEQAYVDDPNNIAIYDVETILEIDDSVRPYLNSLCGRAYERVDSKETFKRVSDFGFGSDLDEV